MKIGIYQSYWGRVGGGQRYVAVVAELLAREHEVEIVHHAAGFDAREVEEPLDVDLSRVAFRYVPRPVRNGHPGATAAAKLACERDFGAELSQPYDLYIDSSDTPPYFCHARRGVLLTHFPLVTYRDFNGYETDAWRQRRLPHRLAASLYHQWEWQRRFRSYQLCIVNSRFTQHWTRRLWGQKSDILNPPLREGLRPQTKESTILTIGAFRRAGHKRHDVTIQAFQKLCDQGIDGWRYVVVGACGNSPSDLEYVEELRDLAAGYPIELRTDVSGQELTELLQRSTIVWHSMGYGIDERQAPRLMEHFGMVATEALAAGAIPVVFNGGGLREIVTHRENGFLWTTVNELCDCTSQLIADAQLRKRLSSQAVRSAEKYSRPEFERRLREVCSPVLN